ncbi:hypothetical protein [Halobacillus andaensis]
MYLGRNYKVISYATEEPAASLLFNKGKFIFTYPSHYSTKDQETAFLQQEENWLKNRAEQKLKELTAISCEDNYRLGYKDKAAIYLNWRLIKRNKNQIQTIIDDLRNEKMY